MRFNYANLQMHHKSYDRTESAQFNVGCNRAVKIISQRVLLVATVFVLPEDSN